jgi:phage gp46-like protein
MIPGRATFLDLALVYDPGTRRCDLAFGPDSDLLVDDTAATPMLMTIGTDRRAEPGDVLPEGADVFGSLRPADRRGWVGDILDRRGRRLGTRLWLLDRAKESEQTTIMAKHYLSQGFAWVGAETGRPATIEVAWPRRNTMAFRVAVGGDEIAMTWGGGR